MPVLDGIQLLKKIKFVDPLSPSFVFISAFSDINLVDALDLGVHAAFAKPIDQEMLVKCVEAALTPFGKRFSTPYEHIETLMKISLDEKVMALRQKQWVV